MEPFDIIGNITKPLFKMILVTIKKNVLFDKVNAMKNLFFEDRLSTCNLGIYSQDWLLSSEFITEFFTNVALRNP